MRKYRKTALQKKIRKTTINTTIKNTDFLHDLVNEKETVFQSICIASQMFANVKRLYLKSPTSSTTTSLCCKSCVYPNDTPYYPGHAGGIKKCFLYTDDDRLTFAWRKKSKESCNVDCNINFGFK